MNTEKSSLTPFRIKRKNKNRQLFRFIVFTFLSCFILIINAQNKPIRINFNKTSIVNEKVCGKNRIPLEGLYKIKYDNQKIEISNFKSGLREGKSQIILKHKPEEEGVYSQNLKNGEWKYYFNGELRLISTFRNDLKDGEETYFEGKNRAKSKVLNYRNGKLDGLQYTYSYSGELESEFSYRNGHICDTAFFFNYRGEISKKIVYTSSSNSYCVRFDSLRDKNKCYRVIDSIFYKNEILFHFNSSVDYTTLLSINISDNILSIDSLSLTKKHECIDSIKIDFYKDSGLTFTILIPIVAIPESEKLKDFINHIVDKSGKEYLLFNNENELYVQIDPCDLDFYLLFYEVPLFVKYPHDKLREVKIIKGDGDMLGGCVTEQTNE